MWACARWSSANHWGKCEWRLHSTLALFHPILLGTVTKLWNTQRSLSPQSVHNASHYHTDYIHIYGISRWQARLEILVIKPGNLWPFCEKHYPVRKRNLVFDYQKCQQMVLTGVAEGYWHIRGGPFPPGLPQGALFTQILCNSLFRLCALSDISAYFTRTVETETTE